MEYLNLNKLLNRFLDWKIILILHCGNDLLTALCKRFLKFKENVPKYGRTTVNSIFWHCQYNLLREVQFVQKLFNTFVNYINKVVTTFENTSQVFYFYMKFSILEQILKNRNRSVWTKPILQVSRIKLS